MPPTSAPHLLGWFIEIGMIEPGAAGPVPLSWREIEAWQVSSGVSLEPWEARLMRRLSTEYLNEGQKAEPENCPPPWRAPITQADRDAEEADLRGLMG